MKIAYNQKFKTSLLKETIDPVEFYSAEGIEIKRKNGSSWKLGGLCPFHKDHHIGSFYIHVVSGGFQCFSCGAKGGDIIDFTQKKHGLQFYEAICKLANEWGCYE